MRVIDPGHRYKLRLLDTPDIPGADTEVLLVFVKREGEGYPGNVGHHEGTTMQEVLRACIDRSVYVNKQIPCSETSLVIAALERAVYVLEARAARLHGRPLNFTAKQAVSGPTCPGCGHVGCDGTCRRFSCR